MLLSMPAPCRGGTEALLDPGRLLARRSLTDLQAGPDGRRVAWTVSEPPRGERHRRHIWVLDVETRAARQFTYSKKSEWAARWSPDGRRLAFVSDRGDSPQLYLMPSDGGEAEKVADEEVADEAPAWAPDGSRIAFIGKEKKSDLEKRREKEKNDARVVDKDDKPGRLFITDPQARSTRPLTPPDWEVSELQWLPRGDRLLLLASDRPHGDRWSTRIVLVDARSGALTTLASPAGPIAGLKLSPDGRAAAFVGPRVDGPEPHDLYLLDLPGGEGTGAPGPGSPGRARNLTAQALDRAVEAYLWDGNGALVLLVQEGFTNRLIRVTTAGAIERLPELPMLATDLALLTKSRIAFIGERTAVPAEIWIGGRDGEGAHRAPAPITRLNESAGEAPLVAPQILKYKSFDGVTIEAALLTPRGQAAGHRSPLVVLVHGGPTGRWEDRFEAWGQLLAARGFAVLYPNLRGSTGYGARFVEMNRRDWGGGDSKDLLAGVDELIARGIADPERLGIGGWSYGGYMAMWAVTQTGRFKAAVAGAGLSDLASEYGTEDDPAYDEWFYGLPYEDLVPFTRSSPVTYAKQVRTPTLLLQGEDDTVDPPGQSQQLYRALKRYDVPCELVLYPREGHGFREEKHQIDRLERVLAWFATYVQGPAPARQPEEHPGSTP